MKSKTLLAIMLTLCFCLCVVLVSCGGGDTADGSTSNSTTADGNGESVNNDSSTIDSGETDESTENSLTDSSIDGGDTTDSSQEEEKRDEPHEHSYGEWQTTKEPTCTEAGEEKQKCPCGDTKSKEIPPTGHKYVDGYCSVCEEKEPASEGLKYTLSEDGTYYIVSGIGTCTDTELYIPSTYEGLPVTSIGYRAFSSCRSLTSITIPESVTSIGEYAFYDCTSLTEINFNAAETADLGSYNFVFCNAGTNGNGITVNIGRNVTKLPSYLFCPHNDDLSYAPKITSVEFEENSPCTNIGDYAFYYCTSLESVTIGENVTSIGSSAFEGCTGIENVTIGENVTSIGSSAFEGCTGIENVTIGENVTSIGYCAFEGCASLTSITIPDSVTSIGAYAFRCESLARMNFLGDIEGWCKISFGGSFANPLYYAKNLYIKGELVTELVIPNTVAEIKAYTFAGCTSFTSITIPESVTSIGKYAFYNCTSLTEINFNATEMADLSEDNYVFYNTGANGNGIMVNIGSNVTKIPSYLFCPHSDKLSYAPKITSVTIGENVTSIGAYAFYYCTNLTSITIPESVTSMGFGVFHNCINLTEINFNATEMADLGSYNGVFYNAGTNGNGITVNIGSNVTKIPSYLFHPHKDALSFSCAPKITSVTIGEGVTSIGEYAFCDCTSLTEINFNATEMADLGSYNYVFYGAGRNGNGITVNIGSNVTKIPSFLFYPESFYSLKITSLVFEENSRCTSIGDGAFYNCTSLTTVTIPDGVTSIGYSAFRGCTSLTSITIPESVTSIGDCAFYNCKSLTSITIPENVTSIGREAFYYCTNLTSITIPENVTSIGDRAFWDCKGLTKINFNATEMADLSKNNYAFDDAGTNGNGITVNIGSNVTKIPSNLFYLSSSHAPKITSVVFEENSRCTSIGGGAFYNCTSLTTVTIPDGVTSIGGSAFEDCTSLTSITIPGSVTSIGEDTFWDCTSLKSVNYLGDVADWCNISFGDISANPLYYAEELCLNGRLVTALVIPDTVTEIKTYAFYDCPSLTSVTIPDSVTSIGCDAFFNCTSLTIYCQAEERLSSWDMSWEVNCGSVVWGCKAFGVTKDGLIWVQISSDEMIIIGNVGKEEVIVIPSNINDLPVTCIGDYAFRECTSLTSVTIPNSVTSIGEYTFYNCTSLTEINFNATEMADLSKNNYAFYNAGANGNGITVNIGNNVTKIPSYLFYLSSSHAPKITSVAFEENSKCTSIGKSAFYGCEDLESVTIGENVTSIGGGAFYKCTSLTSITIPNSVTSVGGNAFYGCESLTIYCEAESQPSGWDSDWNYSGCPVIWGYEQ